MLYFSFNFLLFRLCCCQNSLFTALFLTCVLFQRSASKLQYDFVTCGSVIKLYNLQQQIRLHSHDVKYGSGSGQQSVTGVGSSDDVNSHWAIRGKLEKACNRGEPIKCGSVIRLQHLPTGCNLHSHLFESPLSHNQEVSCFGKEGDGDTGDHWEVQCDGDFWERDDGVRIKHVDTGLFLSATSNRYGRPIAGQGEICALHSSSKDTLWKTMEGIFVKPVLQDSRSAHQEL